MSGIRELADGERWCDSIGNLFVYQHSQQTVPLFKRLEWRCRCLFESSFCLTLLSALHGTDQVVTTTPDGLNCAKDQVCPKFGKVLATVRGSVTLCVNFVNGS